MNRNYSMILKQMQMAYMGALKKEQDEEVCSLCWENNCGCGAKSSVKNDPFINLTTASEFKYA